MGPKRTAATPKKAAGRASKARKTEETPLGLDLPEELREVVAAFSGVASLSASCRQMLQAMAPFAFGTYRPQRHEFQSKLAKCLCQELEQEQAQRKTLLAKLEEEAEELRGEEAASATEAEKARSAAAAALGAKEAAAAAHNAAVAETAEARAALEREQAALTQAQAARELREGRRAAQQQLLEESWQPLIDGVFAGREWRRRDRALHALQKSLRSGSKSEAGEDGSGGGVEMDAPESLLQGFGAALKLKPNDRGSFAQKAIEHGKKALDALAEALAAKVTEAEERVTAQGDAVSKAEAALKSAEEKQEKAVTVSIDAENAWAEAESEVGNLKDAQQTRSFQGRSLSEKLDAAKAGLAEIATIITKASELEEREGPKIVEEPEAPADAPAAEEP